MRESSNSPDEIPSIARFIWASIFSGSIIRIRSSSSFPSSFSPFAMSAVNRCHLAFIFQVKARSNDSMHQLIDLIRSVSREQCQAFPCKSRKRIKRNGSFQKFDSLREILLCSEHCPSSVYIWGCDGSICNALRHAFSAHQEILLSYKVCQIIKASILLGSMLDALSRIQSLLQCLRAQHVHFPDLYTPYFSEDLKYSLIVIAYSFSISLPVLEEIEIVKWCWIQWVNFKRLH